MILAVIAVLASITTIALTTTSILLLWKPQLIDKFKTGIYNNMNTKYVTLWLWHLLMYIWYVCTF